MFSFIKYLGLLLFSIITTVSTQTYIDNKYAIEMRNKNIILHDIRNFLPFVYNITLKFLLDFSSGSLPFYTFTIWSCDEKKILILSWSILVLLRTICFSITILPPPSHVHHPFKFTGGSCDAIFSGHTMMVVLNFMILMKYHNPFILWCLSFLYSICVLISRSHYSVDVFLAYVITISVYLNISNNFIFINSLF
jgi:hypothetical protein